MVSEDRNEGFSVQNCDTFSDKHCKFGMRISFFCKFLLFNNDLIQVL